MFLWRTSKHSARSSRIRNYATKVRILKSTSTDPFVNLATEDWLFNDCDPTHQTLYLWRNEKAVVIGKHQNPWKECFVQKMDEEQVHLVRRRSGGGAVYQDLGNSIFTFVSPKLQYDKMVNFQIVIQALRNGFDIETQLSGRNDIVTTTGRKVSGSAFKIGTETAVHHGTLLVNLDMNALQRFLNPHKLKLASKGVASVVSRVVNLQELNTAISHHNLCEHLIAQFRAHYMSECQVTNWLDVVGCPVLLTRCKVEEIDSKTLEAIPSWKKYYDELRDWNWRFGKTPQFSHNFETKFDWGLMDVYLESEKNMIKSCKLFSDTLYPIVIEKFQEHLIGQRYSPEGILAAAKLVKDDMISAAIPDVQIVIKHVEELAAWIAHSL